MGKPLYKLGQVVIFKITYMDHSRIGVIERVHEPYETDTNQRFAYSVRWSLGTVKDTYYGVWEDEITIADIDTITMYTLANIGNFV